MAIFLKVKPKKLLNSSLNQQILVFLSRNTIFAITIRPYVFKNNTIAYTKNKYFYQII